MSETQTNDATQLEDALGLRAQRFEIRGRTITVREFTMQQLPALLRIMADARRAGRHVTSWIDPEGNALPMERDDFILGMLEQGESALSLIRMAAPEIQDDTPVAALVPLIAAVFEVNKDFFGLPEIAAAISGLSGNSTPATPGPISSEPSPAAATA